MPLMRVDVLNKFNNSSQLCYKIDGYFCSTLWILFIVMSLHMVFKLYLHPIKCVWSWSSLVLLVTSNFYTWVGTQIFFVFHKPTLYCQNPCHMDALLQIVFSWSITRLGYLWRSGSLRTPQGRPVDSRRDEVPIYRVPQDRPCLPDACDAERSPGPFSLSNSRLDTFSICGFGQGEY